MGHKLITENTSLCIWMYLCKLLTFGSLAEV